MWTKVDLKVDRNKMIDDMKKSIQEAAAPILEQEVQKLDNMMMILNNLRENNDEHLRGEE